MKFPIFCLLLCLIIITPVLADNITVVTPSEIPTGYVPTPTPTATPTPVPTISSTPYIYQGESVYINDTIDISGVVPPYPELAYWNGYDMYDANASYIITLPAQKEGYYHFYLDPAIFSTRTGKWYKYDDKFEKNGNSLAFVVIPQSMKNSTMRYPNGTLINISGMIVNNYYGMEIPIQPPVEVKHVSDYLIARGDSFNISVNNATNIWLFGRVNQLLDFKSTNSPSIDISKDVLSDFEPGAYTVLLQTYGNISNNFTVMYDDKNNMIKWFDPSSFTILELSIDGLSPQVLSEKFLKLIPQMSDIFKTYKLEFQMPSIEIQSISEQLTPNETIDAAGVTQYNTNVSFVEVKGYTNVAIGSVLKFVVDKDQQTSRTLNSHTTTAVAGGTDDPGDMRWFDVVVPIDKYNLAIGAHTITAYTNYSDSGSVYTFTIYATPPNSYVPPQTIRYIAGRNGPEEFVPTPTPVVETVTVPVPGPTQIVIQTVTPTDEQVKAQQKIIMDEKINAWITIVIASAIIIAITLYLISLYLRRRELK
jgi:hypothetical protein